MNFFRPHFSLIDKLELLSVARTVFGNGTFIGGDQVTTFEQQFASYLGAQSVVGCANGFDAIRIAIRSLNLPSKSQIAVSGHTFFATWLAILSEGHVPIGIDIELQTGQMSLDKLKNGLREFPNIQVVIYVHMHGIEGDIVRISELCEERGIVLIEDCAQAHGLEIRGRKAGTWGTLGCFSFYPTKNLGAFGDAGCIVDNQNYTNLIRSIANYGWAKDSRDLHVEYGMNSRLDSLQAAFLSNRLKKLDFFNHKRREIASFYLSHIEDKPQLSVLGRSANSVWHHFPVLVENRDNFRSFLKLNGVPTQIHYPVPSHLQPLIRKQFGYLVQTVESLQETEFLSRHIVSIPLHPWLKLKQQRYIVDVVNNWTHSVSRDTK